MSVLISGGCKNGKSYYAQELARAMGAPLYYIATMIPHDAEDEARIERHRRERAGWGFETIECGRDILRALDGTNLSGAFLLDSTTALLSNEMFSSDGIDPTAGERVARALCEFVQRAPNTVVVSDGIYSDANRYDAWTECYRRNLARIDCALAQVCDTVIEVVAGLKIVYRGSVLL